MDTDNEQSVTVKVKNDEALYSLKAGALLSGDSNRRKYEPLLEYKAPEGGRSHDRFIGKKGGRGKQQSQTYAVGGEHIIKYNEVILYQCAIVYYYFVFC